MKHAPILALAVVGALAAACGGGRAAAPPAVGAGNGAAPPVELTRWDDETFGPKGLSEDGALWSAGSPYARLSFRFEGGAVARIFLGATGAE